MSAWDDLVKDMSALTRNNLIDTGPRSAGL
jgi:hypothetical protein